MQTLPRVSRRMFLRRLAATGLAAPFVARGWMAVSPNGKLRHASFGATGMAWAEVNEIARHASVTVVAAAVKSTNVPQANAPVRRTHRRGWAVAGLQATRS